MLRIAGSLVGAVCLLATGLVFAYPEQESNPPEETQSAQRGGPPDRPDGRPEFDRGRFGRGGPPDGPDGRPEFDRGRFGRGGPGFGPPGFGLGGPGGFGGERKLVKDYDRDGDGRLNAEERAEARKASASDQRGGFGRPRGFGGPGGMRGFGGPGGPEGREPGKPGPRVSPADVEIYPEAPLYDLNVVRTLFLEFENDDWEEELAAFKDTDVEVPVTLTVDGKKYEDVGVHFRGMSSYGMIPAGLKRSLNLSLDFVHDKQRIDGYKTLNLLNCNGDPSMMNTVLFSAIARKHMPAPKANFVRVVINGESWGLYANAQQFNKEFVEENYGSSKGERWKVPGRPGGDSGLAYVGENVDDYKQRYEIKSGDDEKAWKDLIALCKTLDQTPPDRLVKALEPILDIDEVLWFLALDVALVNEDGYWTRASDYSLYQDKDGRFHVIPHDMNETFHAGGGPGGFGPPGGRPGFGPGGPGFGGPGFGGPDFGGQGFPPPGETPNERNRPRRPGGVEDPGDRRTVDREQEFPGRPGFGRDRNDGGRGRGPGGFPGMGPRGGVTLDPLVALDDPSKPLRSKLLAVPELRKKYLANVRTIAQESLDWKTLGPEVEKLRKLIQDDVKADTRKLASYDEFLAATASEPAENGESRHMPFRTFAEKRRAYLLKTIDAKPTRN